MLWRGWTTGDPGPPIAVERARGAYVWDGRGRRYLDAVAGGMTASLGHAHPELIETARRQLETVAHSDAGPLSTAATEDFAASLTVSLPAGLDHVALVNSGSEAMECALRVAADHHALAGDGRRRVLVALTSSYHGTTALAQSLGGLPHLASPWHPPAPISHVAVPVPAREARRAKSRGLLADRLRAAVEKAGPEQVLAVVAEPMLNLGGGIVLPPGFLADAKEIARAAGALFIADEVFTGFGRTGRLFAVEHDGVVPDILAMSKGMTSGCVPLAATAFSNAVRERHAAADQPLRYGHTTSGHAVAAAVASTVLAIMRRDGICRRVSSLGPALRERLRSELKGPLGRGRVLDVRGLGLAMAVEFAEEAEAARAGDMALASGLVLKRQGATLLASPPLNIGGGEAEELCELAAQAVRDSLAGRE